MATTTDHDAFFDRSAFPIVVWRTGPLATGYSTRWMAAMDALLAADEPFVFLFFGAGDAEAPEDRKARALWMKANRTRFADLCLASISVEADPLRLDKRRAQAQGMQAATGLRVIVAASDDEAWARARDLVEQARR